jgi:hypothetical protein
MIDSRQGYLAGAQPLVVSDSAKPALHKASQTNAHRTPSHPQSIATRQTITGAHMCRTVWIIVRRVRPVPALPTSGDKRTPTSQVNGS